MAAMIPKTIITTKSSTKVNPDVDLRPDSFLTCFPAIFRISRTPSPLDRKAKTLCEKHLTICFHYIEKKIDVKKLKRHALYTPKKEKDGPKFKNSDKILLAVQTSLRFLRGL